MTATTVETTADTVPATRTRPVPAPTPFGRVLRVELRKMFDTRSGFWLMASIVITSVIATALTIILGDRDSLGFEQFAAAIGSPMSIVLPIIGVLAVTSEWSQRTALTTFTFVPHRGRVLRAKLINTLAIGLVSMLVALGVGALHHPLQEVGRGQRAHAADDADGPVLDRPVGAVLGLRAHAPSRVPRAAGPVQARARDCATG